MAVMTVLKSHCSNKQASKKKIVRVLLDGGSDGDLLMQKREQTNHSPT